MNNKKVSIWLGIGIALVPLIFSWFTLRKGYSRKSKIISFGWLLLALALSGDYLSTNKISSIRDLALDIKYYTLKKEFSAPALLKPRIAENYFNSTPSKPIPKAHQLPATDWEHFIFYGQSLSVGIQSRPAITTKAKYDSLTFIGGPKATMKGSVGYNPGMGNVKLLTEDNLWGDMPNAYRHGETPSSGLSDGVIQLSAKENNIQWDSDDKQLFVNTAGLGSASIKNLLPSSISPGGEWWLNIKNSVEQAYVQAQLKGKSYSLHGVGWIQGEGDAIHSTYGEYKSDLKEMHSAVQNLSESTTGLKHPVAFFTYQTYGRSGRKSNIPQAQLDYAIENENAYFATPIYHLPMAPDGHLNNAGSYLLGRYFAKAYKSVSVDKQQASWINPISSSLKGNVITIKYEVPYPPLALDNVRLAKTKDFGYRVIDTMGTVPIKNITVVNGDEVHISLSRQPKDITEIRYAYDYLGNGLVDYDSSASGNLRDSDPEIASFHGDDYPLFNVAPHHKLTLTELYTAHSDNVYD